MNPPLVTLTSDFGPGPFVGLMKGVILGLCPQARLVDLCHDLPPRDIMAGALVLEQAPLVFGPGTIHLAVVDPGVGTSRRPLVVSGLEMLWVGPDNGLFTPVLLADRQARAWSLDDGRYLRRPVSATFHGRDVFAPVAAHLALGLPPQRLGRPVADPVLLDWPQPREDEGALLGQVLAVDRFGNLMTNLGRRQVEGFLAGRPALIQAPGLDIHGLSQAYGQAPPGQPLALFNSLERLELALSQGDLCRRLGLPPQGARGLLVRVRPAK